MDRDAIGPAEGTEARRQGKVCVEMEVFSLKIQAALRRPESPHVDVHVGDEVTRLCSFRLES
jgi:hypothetical protein